MSKTWTTPKYTNLDCQARHKSPTKSEAPKSEYFKKSRHFDNKLHTYSTNRALGIYHMRPDLRLSASKRPRRNTQDTSPLPHIRNRLSIYALNVTAKPSAPIVTTYTPYAPMHQSCLERLQRHRRQLSSSGLPPPLAHPSPFLLSWLHY